MTWMGRSPMVSQGDQISPFTPLPKLSIVPIGFSFGLSFGLLTVGLNWGKAAIALPGEAPEIVADWIYENPNLPSGLPGSLRVSRSDIPGQRLTFQALRILPGFFQDEPIAVIRSEQIEVRDEVNGVTAERLANVLRSVYGSDIDQDYQNAVLVYDYRRVAAPGGVNAPELEAGSIVQGDRFAYWLRILRAPDGEPIVGQLTVLLPDDRDRLEVYLRRQGSGE